MKIHEKPKEKKKLKLEPGFKQFLWKIVIFVAVFLGIQLLTMQLSAERNISFLTPIYIVDLAKVGIFVVVLFFVAYREKLFKLEKYKFELKSAIIFGVLEILAVIFYFKYKTIILNNLEIAHANLLLFQILTYFILILTLIFLVLAIFGIKFTWHFIKRFKKELLISLGSFIILYILSNLVQKSWHYFSGIVAKSVYWLLNITSTSSLSYIDKTPVLGLDNFVVQIAKACSGIESMFLFTMLYFFITCFDWKILNKKKLTIMFIPGLISVFALNILRIYLLMLIGANVSRNLALGLFHTNASWILFIVYFILFWGLLYKWMKK